MDRDKAIARWLEKLTIEEKLGLHFCNDPDATTYPVDKEQIIRYTLDVIEACGLEGLHISAERAIEMVAEDAMVTYFDKNVEACLERIEPPYAGLTPEERNRNLNRIWGPNPSAYPGGIT